MVKRFDVDEHLMSRLQLLGPRIFHGAIAASIEVRVLGEMVEAVAGAVEASSDKMTAIIVAKPVRLACLRLIAA